MLAPPLGGASSLPGRPEKSSTSTHSRQGLRDKIRGRESRGGVLKGGEEGIVREQDLEVPAEDVDGAGG